MSAIQRRGPWQYDDEQRVLEGDPCLSEAKCRIPRRSEVVRDDDVGRRLLQPERHGMCVREMPRLDGLLCPRDRPNDNPRVLVEALPGGIDRVRCMLPEQNLDRVAEPGQRERQERRCGAHPSDRLEAAQLVSDHGHTASVRHVRKRNVHSFRWRFRDTNAG